MKFVKNRHGAVHQVSDELAEQLLSEAERGRGYTEASAAEAAAWADEFGVTIPKGGKSSKAAEAAAEPAPTEQG